MIAKKYIFKNEAESNTFITNLGVETITDEITNEELIVPTHKNNIFKVGFGILEEATYNENNEESTPTVFDTQYVVDVIWFDGIPEEWTPKEVLMNGEQSSISGVFYETRRARLGKALKKGIIIPNGNQTYWFNKESLNDFITMKNNLLLLKVPSIKWKATDKNWYDIPMSEALQISVQGQIQMQKIFENN